MRTPALLAAIALAGCTQTKDPTHYPSLLPRPIEGQSFAEPVRPAPVATPDTALDSQIAALRGRLQQAGSRFSGAAQEAEARVAVARGLPEGSEKWLDAQTALATLGGMRAPAAAALSELEELALNRGVAGQPPYRALDEAVEAARTQVEAQDDRIGGLEAALAGA
jgi:hypothetical protein